MPIIYSYCQKACIAINDEEENMPMDENKGLMACLQGRENLPSNLKLEQRPENDFLNARQRSAADKADGHRRRFQIDDDRRGGRRRGGRAEGRRSLLTSSWKEQGIGVVRYPRRHGAIGGTL